MQSQESPTLVEQLQALNGQVGNQYFDSPLHCNWSIHVVYIVPFIVSVRYEILHSIWTMEDNIHVSYIAMLRKGLLKILCGCDAAEIF